MNHCIFDSPLINESARNIIKRILSKIRTAAPILYFSTRGTAVQILKAFRFFLLRDTIHLREVSHQYPWLVTGVFFHISGQLIWKLAEIWKLSNKRKEPIYCDIHRIQVSGSFHASTALIYVGHAGCVTVIVGEDEREFSCPPPCIYVGLIFTKIASKLIKNSVFLLSFERAS